MHRFLFRRLFQSVLGVGVTNAYLGGFKPPGALWQGQSKGFCVPTLNCYACPGSLFACPIGTLQHFVIIRSVPVYFTGLFVTLSMSVGRMACGTLCPFGFLQDLLYKFRSFKIRIPSWMTYLKYASLVGLAIIIPFYTLQPWFSKLCPVGTLIGGLPWVTINPEIRAMIHELFWVKIAILIAVVSLAAVAKRPFCRVACPLGAIYSLFNRISILRLAWNEAECSHCDKCTRICPMDIPIYKDANNHNCIRCLDCTQCPAVSITHAFAGARLPASEPTADVPAGIPATA
ncbi:MAG TPA: 4Fe-4S binding protein [Proteobacteria bacterium]|nr:putative electron transport protein YccM [bacterium BMS3Abin14]HDL54098.1 4Fe-4S binding protein [Pseudomonadota bacterium]